MEAESGMAILTITECIVDGCAMDVIGFVVGTIIIR